MSIAMVWYVYPNDHSRQLKCTNVPPDPGAEHQKVGTYEEGMKLIHKVGRRRRANKRLFEMVLIFAALAIVALTWG